MDTWLLPEHLADILPVEARRIEELRRALLDLYRTYGFELVSPPLIEYIDSLLSSPGIDLDLRTCKLVDQLSGRTLGIRADITPQISRIDTHLLNREGVARLCYCGTVLHARPTDLLSSRELLQIGAEIYGHAGIEADLEIIQLAFNTLTLARVQQPRLDLCHLGVARAILNADPLASSQAARIFSLLRDKDVPGLIDLRHAGAMQAETLQALCMLTDLYGDSTVLDRARRELPALPAITTALDTLEVLLAALPESLVSVDLADVRGYGYHSGVTFSLYVQGWHDALVHGGRYDDVSRVFGRARPATGFSLDLRKLAAALPPAEPSGAVRAPWGGGEALLAAVGALRAAGEVVVQILPGHTYEQNEFVCNRELVLQDGTWQVHHL
jgi:ATP phosphoribosyltransferase regulatory subunit